MKLANGPTYTLNVKDAGGLKLLYKYAITVLDYGFWGGGCIASM